jgi:glutamate--cysteine ligase
LTAKRLTRRDLIDYFLEACKPRSQWLVGMEVEKMGRAAGGGAPIPYHGEAPSVRAVLEAYHARRGGDPVYEGDRLVGMAGRWGTLSLEPGGQVEWSSPACADLDALGMELAAHLDALDDAGRAAAVHWLDVAVEPEHPVEEMPWMPKARYKIMGGYLGARGALAHRMMTQTASIQCAFDFESAADWARKFRAAAWASPVAVALFANSSRVDGADSGFRSFRQRIWRATDPDRCDLPPVVFDDAFGIDAWVDWLLGVPAMLRERARGLVPAGGATFDELLRRRDCTAVGIDDWELHLSTIFTEVRSYGYIEVRCADLVPDPLVLAVPALWTGLLYHAGGLEAVREQTGGRVSHRAWLEAMESAARLGLEGEAYGRPLGALAAELLAAAALGLRSGAACAGSSPDPALPLRRLAASLGLGPPAPAP